MPQQGALAAERLEVGVLWRCGRNDPGEHRTSRHDGGQDPTAHPGL